MSDDTEAVIVIEDGDDAARSGPVCPQCGGIGDPADPDGFCADCADA